MGKARAINLDTRHFAKAGDAAGFFSTMLQRYALGDKLTALDQADLNAMLKRHDEAAEKIGSGVIAIEVAHSPPPYERERCFWLLRRDGTRIDISYKHCLEKKPYD